MVSSKGTFGSFAVSDLEAAKEFYSATLGLDVKSEEDPLGNGVLWIHGPGPGSVMVYSKPEHTPAGFTVYNLEVDDLEAACDDLSGRGATFERYEQMEPDDRGIVRQGGIAAAWLKDPSGNVVGLMERSDQA
ncbi:VOC family protein [Nocardioides sp. GCM10027113]|uniref:VOC family protein n=1 Tax=unclassified Nocardioides TaxID=2615069 RepID=UPI0036220485